MYTFTKGLYSVHVHEYVYIYILQPYMHTFIKGINSFYIFLLLLYPYMHTFIKGLYSMYVHEYVHSYML